MVLTQTGIGPDPEPEYSAPQRKFPPQVQNEYESDPPIIPPVIVERLNIIPDGPSIQYAIPAVPCRSKWTVTHAGPGIERTVVAPAEEETESSRATVCAGTKTSARRVTDTATVTTKVTLRHRCVLGADAASGAATVCIGASTRPSMKS